MNAPDAALVPDTAELMARATELLRGLPRDRREVPAARARVAEWARGQPGVQVALVVDDPPASVRVEYDLLLTFPGQGTLALSWRADTGTPWLVLYADHWAANYVVTVDDQQRLTVQQALVMLRAASTSNTDLMTAMVDHLLWSQLAEDDTLAATDDELQAAADQFRRRHDLHSAAATQTWLAEMRMSADGFAMMLEQSVRIAKAKDRIVASRAGAYVGRHRARLDRLQVLEVEVERDLAGRLAEEAQQHGLLGALDRVTRAKAQAPIALVATMSTRLAHQLPELVRAAAPGAIVGPVTIGDRARLFQIYDRRRAQLDPETLALVRQLVLDEWLAERRASADIRWHWL